MRKIFVITTILSFILASGFLQAHIVFNQINNLYIPIPGISPPKAPEIDDGIRIDTHIKNGATNLLKTTAKFQEVLCHIELNAPDVDFYYLNASINTSIISLELTRHEYSEICKKVVMMSQNPYLLQRLHDFDYQNFYENRKPNESIYNQVILFLQTGNINGLFEKELQTVKCILSHLYKIRAAINEEKLPLDLFYRANDSLYSAILFGQYTAEIVREILKE